MFRKHLQDIHIIIFMIIQCNIVIFIINNSESLVWSCWTGALKYLWIRWWEFKIRSDLNDWLWSLLNNFNSWAWVGWVRGGRFPDCFIDRDTRLCHALFIFLSKKELKKVDNLISLNLKLYQNSPVNLLQLLISLLNVTFPLLLPLQYPDVVHRSFQYWSFVLPDISHDVIILLILLGQKCSQLLYPVIDVESSATLNYSNITVSIFLHIVKNIFNLLMLWLSFFCLSFCSAFKSSSPRGSSLTRKSNMFEEGRCLSPATASWAMSRDNTSSSP